MLKVDDIKNITDKAFILETIDLITMDLVVYYNELTRLTKEYYNYKESELTKSFENFLKNNFEKYNHLGLYSVSLMVCSFGCILIKKDIAVIDVLINMLGNMLMRVDNAIRFKSKYNEKYEFYSEVIAYFEDLKSRLKDQASLLEGNKKTYHLSVLNTMQAELWEQFKYMECYKNMISKRDDYTKEQIYKYAKKNKLDSEDFYDFYQERQLTRRKEINGS